MKGWDKNILKMTKNITTKCDNILQQIMFYSRPHVELCADLPMEGLIAEVQSIRDSITMLEDKLRAREIMYGTNTRIGELSEVVLNDEQVMQFQRYLIYNHAAGIGDPAPIEYVRGAMSGRINVHAHGNSGCRPEITLTLV